MPLCWHRCDRAINLATPGGKFPMVAVPHLSALLTMPPPTANVHPLFRNGIFIFPKTATKNSKPGT